MADEEAPNPCSLCEAVALVPHDELYVAIKHKRGDAMMIVATAHDQKLDTALHELAFDQACFGLLARSNGLTYWKQDGYKGNTGTNQHVRRIFTLQPTYTQLPQKLADAITAEADMACSWFFDAGFEPADFMAVPTKKAISDKDTGLRIQGFQYGMDREIARLHGYEFAGGWNWRFDDDWREKHNEWIYHYKAEHEPLCEHFDRTTEEVWHRNQRLDLTELPWVIQRALVTRWQRLWEAYERNPEEWT